VGDKEFEESWSDERNGYTPFISPLNLPGILEHCMRLTTKMLDNDSVSNIWLDKSNSKTILEAEIS
jgi:hypothetical protein